MTHFDRATDSTLPTADEKAQADILDNQAAGASATGAAIELAEAGVIERIGWYRWVICALLFFATTINYLDRMVLGILAPVLQTQIGWNEVQYGYITAAFTGCYAIGLLVVGRLMDRWGTRKGFSIAVTVWSIAAMGHALARTWWGFAIARGALALGESGNFPGATKTVAEWFPKKERALAFGIFNAGSNVGALLAPLLVPLIVAYLGWQYAFVLTGVAGFLWLAVWLMTYRKPEEHPKVTPAELAYINSDPPEPTVKIPWGRLFPHRQTWAFATGKFLTDPVWWFLLFWGAKYLHALYDLDLTGLALPLVVIFLCADVGSIGGGWLSSNLLKRGWSVNAARKTTMLTCAVCVLPMILAPYIHILWVTVGLLSLAAAAHQGWSANLYTLVSDTFPRRAVGSVVGIGSMAGAASGFFASIAIGWVLQVTGENYAALLTVAGSAYVVTLVIIHLLVPRLEPANVT